MREERERFAAAAIAFCLHQDAAFLRHFWDRICLDEQEQRPTAKLSVEIEPRRWSDLLVTWEGSLCAVEIKNGAELKDHQNPAKDAFARSGGYGYYLANRCRDRQCGGRYVVLGWERGVIPDGALNVCGLKVMYRTWISLANDMSDSPLTRDLTSLLSGFGVWAFTSRAMKGKQLSGKLGGFGHAVSILESVRDQFGWPNSAMVEAGSDQLGVHLKAFYRSKPVTGLAEKLWKDSGLTQVWNSVAWIGYLARESESPQRCVYVYCSKERREPIIAKMLSARFSVDDQPGSDRDGDSYCVVIWDGNDALDDISWFKQALEAAGDRAGAG